MNDLSENNRILKPHGTKIYYLLLVMFQPSFILLFSYNTCLAQNNPLNVNDQDVYLKISIDDEFKQKNSVYYDYQWQNGNLVKKDSTIMTNLSFRYDVRNDRFEMWSLVNPNSIKIITLNGKFFIYSSYFDNNYERKGYFELIINGHVKLLKKRHLKTIPGKAGAYGYSSRQSIIETFYIKINNRPASKLDNKEKDLVKIFPEKTEEIIKYIKKTRVNYKKNQDLSRLIIYYNSLFD